MTLRTWSRCASLATLSFLASGVCAAEKEDIEFVAEHLPESAMDNRYATLPVWVFADESAGSSSLDVQGAWSSTETGGLSIGGPLFSASIGQALGSSWRWGALAFYDPLTLKATDDARPLQTLFAPSTPIDRPVPAHFSNLDGRSTDYGVGLFVAHPSDASWLGRHVWVFGALWQRVALRDYRLDYEITSGPQTGLTGHIDFDADYTHLVPFVGFEIPRTFDRWSFSAHALIAWPTPVRGVVGHITGPAFDLHGNTEDVGNGTHFGDPSLTLGLTLVYEPARLSIDVGTFVTQALLEPQIHDGLDSNYVLSFAWHY